MSYSDKNPAWDRMHTTRAAEEERSRREAETAEAKRLQEAQGLTWGQALAAGGRDYTLTARDFKPGMRVELHPGLDDWMRGDRYGEVVDISPIRMRVNVRLDKSGKIRRLPPDRLTIIP